MPAKLINHHVRLAHSASGIGKRALNIDTRMEHVLLDGMRHVHCVNSMSRLYTCTPFAGPDCALLLRIKPSNVRALHAPHHSHNPGRIRVALPSLVPAMAEA